MTTVQDEIIVARFSSPGHPLEGDSGRALSKQIEAQGQEGEWSSPGAARLLCEQSDMLHMLDVQINWEAPWRRLKGGLTDGMAANSTRCNCYYYYYWVVVFFFGSIRTKSCARSRAASTKICVKSRHTLRQN